MVFIYKNKFPQVNDIVYSTVTEINKFNIVCKLKDYNDMVGYMSYQELCKKRRYNLHKIVHINKEIIVQVIGYNEEKNFVELSIKSLESEETEKFVKMHNSYLKLYNLWRYVCLRLYYDYTVEISEIPDDKIEKFMELSLWELIINYEEENYEKFYSELINAEHNNKIILQTKFTDLEKEKIKNILDDISEKKTIKIKASTNSVLNVQSFNSEGLTDIKYVFDYLSFMCYSDLLDKYSIEILYLGDGKYSLQVKELTENLNTDIKNISDLIVNEIKLRCKERNIIFS